MLYHRSCAPRDDMFEFVRDEPESSQSTLRDMHATVTPFILSEQAPIPPWLDIKDNEPYLAPYPNPPVSSPALKKAPPMDDTQMMAVGPTVSVRSKRNISQSPSVFSDAHSQGMRSPSSPRSPMPVTPPPVSLSPAAYTNRDRQFALAQSNVLPPPQRAAVGSRSKSMDGHTYLPQSPSSLRFSTVGGLPGALLVGPPPKGGTRSSRAQSLASVPIEQRPPALPSPWDSYHRNRNERQSQSTLQSLDSPPAWGYAM
jgi:hypothetical protein